MADFRKLLLALIVGALLFTTTVGAAEYACSATAVPTLVRSEALADFVGDILLTCTGTVPTQGIMANIRVTLGTNITSNPISGSISEATLILDNGASGFRGYSSTSPLTPYTDGTQNVYQALQITANEIEWQGVVLAGAGSAGFETIRLTNIRANAQGLGAGAPISAVINITSPTSVPVTNNSLVVANIRQGLTFTVTPVSFKSCVVPDDDEGFTLNFAEGFGTAFKPRLNTTGPSPTPHTVPGGGYQDESGFNPGTLAAGNLLSASSIGAANQGTRFVSRVKTTPTAVSLTVPTEVITDNGLVVRLVTGFSTTAFSGGTMAAGPGSASVSLDSSGNGVLVYEVWGYTSPNTASSFSDVVEILVEVDYAFPGTLGSATANGSFAPISTVATANSTAPEPRFIDTGAPDQAALSIGPCRTILLFPYLTNQAGFDTGVVVSNTSSDPLGTAHQAGACTLSFFGNKSGSALTTAQATQVSPTVPSGSQLVMLLSTAGSVVNGDGTTAACATGACALPGFQGYMFAVCNFQFAHGFAFVSDVGATKLAQGYLALVVPDRVEVGRLPKNAGVILNIFGNNQGEQLGN